MPKLVDHIQYRRDLLRQCFGLFADKGYATITMRQIALGLGVSTGTLYHYFPSKEELFAQMVQSMSEQDLLQVAEILKDAQSLEERIDRAFAFLEERLDYFFKQALIFADFYQQQRREGKDLPNTLTKACEQIEQSIAALLDIRDPDLLMFCMSLWDGIIWQQVYGNHRVNFSAQAKIMTQAILSHASNKSQKPIVKIG